MRLRISLTLLVALTTALTACSNEADPTTTTTTTPPTTQAPTTTTSPVYEVSVAGADLPGDLGDEIRAVYQAALGFDDAAPQVGPALAAHLDGIGATALEAPLVIEANVSSAEAYGEHVAVVTAEDDVVLATSKNGLDWRVVGVKLASLGQGPWYGDEPRQIFVIGSDARTGQDPLKLRADSLHIISMTPDGAHISIVGIPRLLG